ncbi:Panacea domain-containing protein [Asticcacaulis machinosus]|uniref:Panacea domain-containing protein n=1 Tax=Asticcacaulis machinosus TaxID=2984211 RepID=A0ABT5HKR7_9CAUL|nr:Panacea domain-containing protein [Asticcacaulis machinosus]MDC7676845.1 Panacea domain-containing protein [Asticcacaulis machinosus]
MNQQRIRFRINWDKAIEAVDFLARHQNGITQYYVGKVCYFADKEHMLDYGRPVTGDRYIAMEYGPVPSSIRDLLNEHSDLPDEVLDNFHSHIQIKKHGKKQHINSISNGELRHLSGSDKDYLLTALNKYGKMPFSELTRISHDEAWEEAWEISEASVMNPATWLNELPEEDRETAIASLTDRRVRIVV